MLEIPELLNIVQKWENEVRDSSKKENFWFAPLSSRSGEIINEYPVSGTHRDSRARKSLKSWLNNKGLPLKSPHSFRHGHAVYSIQIAKDIGDLKAISMNLMHSNLQITDGVYGVFSNRDLKTRISQLADPEKATNQEIALLLESALRKLSETSNI